MKNKKVEELVERVRLTDEPSMDELDECVAIGSKYVCHEYESAREAYKRGGKAQLTKVLSHPDLALIDREKKIPIPYTPVNGDNVPNKDFALGAKRQREIVKEAGYLPVIPLAEALGLIKGTK